MLTTLEHLENPQSQRLFGLLKAKWAKWRLSDSEHKWLDLSDCQMIGEGLHEIIVFTFKRHIRLSQLTGNHTYPYWVATGPSFSDRWHDSQGNPCREVPALWACRPVTDTASFIEPLRVLAIVSCHNSRWVFDEIMRKLEPDVKGDTEGCYMVLNHRFRKMSVEIGKVLSAARETVSLQCPEIERLEQATSGPLLSFTVAGLNEMAKVELEKRNRFLKVECTEFGAGWGAVYCYTYSAIRDAARIAEEEYYPVKVGKVEAERGNIPPFERALMRIWSQVHFPEHVSVLAVMKCESGRASEIEIHKILSPRKVNAIGTEWFASNQTELLSHLMMLST